MYVKITAIVCDLNQIGILSFNLYGEMNVILFYFLFYGLIAKT